MITEKKTQFLVDELEQLRQQGLFRPLRVLGSAQDTEVVVDGKQVLNLSSNNYLGLTTHPRLKEAMIQATQQWGAGSGAVRTIAGTMTVHEELERRLAEFKHTEASLVFQSGFTANLGVLQSLVREGDVIISDELNHASIIDGIRLSKAERSIFKHRDMDDLERHLEKHRDKRVKLVVTDGVFSMDGDIAPLAAIVERAERFQALVMVDAAHRGQGLGRHGVLRPPLQAGRLCPGNRLSDGGRGAGADPHHRDQRPHGGAARPGVGGLRHGRQGTWRNRVTFTTQGTYMNRSAA